MSKDKKWISHAQFLLEEELHRQMYNEYIRNNMNPWNPILYAALYKPSKEEIEKDKNKDNEISS